MNFFARKIGAKRVYENFVGAEYWRLALWEIGAPQHV
jgi:hypothetical protein